MKKTCRYRLDQVHMQEKPKQSAFRYCRSFCVTGCYSTRFVCLRIKGVFVTTKLPSVDPSLTQSFLMSMYKKTLNYGQPFKSAKQADFSCPNTVQLR